MKIRLGFVSNSSSSSFCIYGACFGTTELQELLKARGFEVGDGSDDYFDIGEVLESGEVEKALQKHGLEYTNDSECDQVYLGRSFTTIKDDETGKQFKESVSKGLKELVGKDVEVDTHEGEIQC